VQDQERCRDVRGVLRRRDLQIRVRRLEPVLADDALEGPADVARATLEHEVIDRALGASGLEAIGMADDPRGHEPSIRAAEHAEPLRIDEVETPKCLVEDGHHILVVARAPPLAALDRAADRAPPFLAVARRAARVRVEHGVAGAGLNLELVEEPVSILGERTAVDVQEERIAATLLEAERADDPGLDFGAVRGDRREAFGLGGLDGRAQIGQPPLAGVDLG